ncbi:MULTISPECIES: TIGR04283 family arsenosugar biosynthesis glycosyltransferase [Prochlorococcus]|uniref:TIGR04283 family arsenosugar biosynthesis glycosyltransferase n=1 Tax=Prochlorococcus TaxID=1218 RepID=UPI000533B432|nr:MULTISPECIES: TIGR04283 family arsenosugar biosynthesis glycosyltransferase [Prochlorococcus]KGG12825.1 Glycosyltransferase [Prochlorococcus sp. MIT 0601]
MAKVNNYPKLSIIIPTLNESSRLPILLADIGLCSYNHEVNIIDAGSSDSTKNIAKISPANLKVSSDANRGLQLHKGGLISKGEWLLFLHADSRLETNWSEKLLPILEDKNSKDYAWFFTFKIRDKGFIYRLLEATVYIRSNIFKRPYGDQGLLISKKLYMQLGGYKKLHLMEDVDFITRILKVKRLRSLMVNIQTDGKRWRNSNLLKNSIKNLIIRYRWSKGEDTYTLYKDYYSLK